MSLREEMDGAAEKGEQVEKNRERAEENREKIEALENMLEKKLEEKIEGLKDEVSQTVKEELQRAQAKRSETSSLEERVSGVEKAITSVGNRLDQGVELREAEDLRRKIGRFVTLADLKTSQEESLNSAMGRLQDWKIQAEGEIKDLKNKLASGVRTIQDSAETISTGAWWSLATGMVGGLVGVMMLALLSWGGYPILPQEARMTPSEISRVERSRYLDRAVEEMTEEEYDQYQTLLKKVGKRVGEPQD
ncbi:DNA repair exonuclease SbcCD ATPase subunit [Salinibacter ruber]|uniref:DNA repair exonuclease SbcCD ATPase subunit n=1 Tax=Salinibacter ruber TaxID=146919 RepID=A0A9X2Q7V9_9BACT|nr:hypothetical protein [Salinibacter ruber]MCS3679375.1 DNA repair exonuclease SbcCD ATPase subunit [Salinibacter ruber]MCS3682647.1 DNA repair exonuclease SbcCD ATPase subunit [Salinibacter ruber]